MSVMEQDANCETSSCSNIDLISIFELEAIRKLGDIPDNFNIRQTNCVCEEVNKRKWVNL
jgi:hypothetical protein